MTKSFHSKIIETNGYTITSSLSEIHIFIHKSIYNPVRRLRNNAVLYSTVTSHGEKL